MKVYDVIVQTDDSVDHIYLQGRADLSDVKRRTRELNNGMIIRIGDTPVRKFYLPHMITNIIIHERDPSESVDLYPVEHPPADPESELT